MGRLSRQGKNATSYGPAEAEGPERVGRDRVSRPGDSLEER
jgi:hypothetical protein